MIAVKLMGGLGNQLFQYAAGKSLSLKHNTQLYIDTSFLEADPKNAYTKRLYELDYFAIEAKKFPKEMIKKIEFLQGNSILNKIRKKTGIKSSITTYLEQGHQFNHQFNSLTDNTHLTGFWQSELYFKSISDTIRKEITIKSEFINGIEPYLELLKNCTSVSLHVRRGDYVNLKHANEFHGICSIHYYEKALLMMNEKHENLCVFVFSDDIEWCKENLQIPNKNKHYVLTDAALKDLYLMQKCNHHIIANSSFSWWGAWLNANTNKTVIAPSKWFNSNDINTSDVIPDSWIKI